VKETSAYQGARSAKRGFTLLSSVIAIGIFAMLSMAVFSASAAITKSARMYREKTTLAALADKYIEIAR
jgi:type II secretory pathway pseudopilin PulG